MQPIVIAEIGCNHKGDINIAKKMIQQAAFCGAQYAKFQKRCNRELLSEKEYNNPHPVPYNSYGETYGEHREFLEFSIEQHAELKQHCENIGIGYACSVWDTTSAKEIAMGLNPDFIKIPSAMNMCMPIYEALKGYGGRIHISFGMTTHEEQARIIKELVLNFGFKKDNLVFYHCTSAYPADFETLNLYEIDRMRKLYGDFKIGFSGHHKGIAVDVAAYTLGAKYIERHFTLDRTWKGTDHAASLEPGGLNKLVRDLEATHKALQYKTGVLPCETDQRKKLKKTELNQPVGATA